MYVNFSWMYTCQECYLNLFSVYFMNTKTITTKSKKSKEKRSLLFGRWGGGGGGGHTNLNKLMKTINIHCNKVFTHLMGGGGGAPSPHLTNQWNYAIMWITCYVRPWWPFNESLLLLLFLKVLGLIVKITGMSTESFVLVASFHAITSKNLSSIWHVTVLS